MVFSSVIFLCGFLPLMIAGYYLAPGDRLKNWLLLLGSLFFYAWGEPKYVFLMLFSITGNFFGGLWIHRQKCRGKSARLLLLLSILFNLGLLFYFKYSTFLLESLSRLLQQSWAIRNVALPIGISFYTFQGMSYVIDVYRENPKENPVVQQDYIKLALYISMFPQLIAGPIVRYSDIQPYLGHRQVSWESFADGTERFIQGLGKKAVFANILGETATQIMETDAGMISAPAAWIGILCYTMQIFYDFSGYSDMAVGLGKIFGFSFLENFNYPYISKSITEFWRRWHISLSQWFRDYLYIPLGGNRRGNVYFNLFVVFLATGIWHGAAWGFLLWGLWHGAFILIERVIKNKKPDWRLPSVLSWAYTMLVVMIGWVLFKLVDLSATISYLKVMFGIEQAEFIRYGLSWYLNGRVLTVLLLAILCCFPWKKSLCGKIPAVDRFCQGQAFAIAKRLCLLGVLFISFLLIANSTYNPFIYFRF